MWYTVVNKYQLVNIHSFIYKLKARQIMSQDDGNYPTTN